MQSPHAAKSCIKVASGIKSSRFKKIVSLLTIAFFTFQQVVLATPIIPGTAPEGIPEEQTQTEPESQLGDEPPVMDFVSVTSDQFLQDTLRLSPASDDEESADKAEPSSLNFFPQTAQTPSARQNYEYEKYAFEEALPMLEQGLPIAVILRSVNSNDFEQLLRLPFETALATMDGEIVLFTSGDETQIKANQPVLDLLENAENITHFHVAGHEQDGPSQFDINHAVKVPDQEFVVTDRNILSVEI